MDTLQACSTTSAIEDGEQLYTGMKTVKYVNYEQNKHFTDTKEEIDAALAATPTGALFGSPYWRNPLPFGLWIWNATEGKPGALAKWMNNSFGTSPVLMSDVNPKLRASVGESTLASNGYFQGKIDYEELTLKNPKKGKIAYSVDMGPLYRIGSLDYVNFPSPMDSIIRSEAETSAVKVGDGFSVNALEAERARISQLLRDSGYYFFQPGYSTYLADTVSVRQNVQLRLLLPDSLDEKILHPWYIGKTNLNFRKQNDHHLTDSVSYRILTIRHSGKKVPLRPAVVLADMHLRPRGKFSETLYRESLNNLMANDLFSAVDVTFSPRDTTPDCNVLDMTIDCVFDKMWDLSLEGKVTSKTSSRTGPGADLSITRRNLFRYGEKVTLNVYGSYEWQTGGSGTSQDVNVNSYEYGADLTFEIPRLLAPFVKRRRWAQHPTTLIKASNQVLNRGGYFNRHIMAAELTYTIQPKTTVRHIFSPLILTYDYMNSMSSEFEQIVEHSPYLKLSMQDQFIPKMRYTFSYTSPLTYRNPIKWEMTVSESGNIVSLANLAAGKSWDEKNKTLIRNPYAQFLKLETDFTKKWKLNDHDDFVAHASAGVLWAFGNSEYSPYSEQFFVGGANSIRAFTVRSVGPGRFYNEDVEKPWISLLQTGDVKFVANAEYRPRLFGSLYGAVFVDVGNVWELKNVSNNSYAENYSTQFKFRNMFRDLAVGTGIGLRYDLDFFVIRFDWGLGLHMPYDTGKSGFFNVKRFKDSHSFHLAVGYPF